MPEADALLMFSCIGRLSQFGPLACDEGLEVSWLPSYGPEMRGGTANCHVTISNKKIGSPLVPTPNGLIAMNGPSLEEFEDVVEKGGTILVNSSIIDRKVKRTDVKAFYVPVTDIANTVGVRQAANMVALGSYLAATKSMPADKLFGIISRYLKKKNLVDQNIEAIKRGIAEIEKQRG
jgi:2-oxoglutarate ferredoxin oxidoreductase subunit gamma